MVDTTGLTKPEVLKALYENSRPMGTGFLHTTPGDMSVLDAAHLLECSDYFDYHNGRAMKVDLSGAGAFEEAEYDRDNGYGAAQAAINRARAAKS